METIKKQQAVQQLRQAIADFGPDEIVEIYNELFPREPASEVDAHTNRSTLIEKIFAHIESGLQIEEILDLWNVVFPNHHSVWFDEHDDQLHYDPKSEPVGHME